MIQSAKRINRAAPDDRIAQARCDFEANEFQANQFQASFDFLPTEIRVRHRFGSDSAKEQAERRAQLKFLDRQVISTGSRLAAARLREILRPTEQFSDVTEPVPEMDRLAQQRAQLRELGATLFYFRDEAAELSEQSPVPQRLHPRPLPSSYFN